MTENLKNLDTNFGKGALGSEPEDGGSEAEQPIDLDALEKQARDALLIAKKAGNVGDFAAKHALPDADYVDLLPPVDQSPNAPAPHLDSIHPEDTIRPGSPSLK